MHVYRRGGSGWTEGDPLKFPDAYDYAGQFARAIEITDAYVLAAGYNTNRRADAVYLFRNEPANAFPHVALLTVASSNGLYDAVIDGNRVLANGFGYPGIFELPASFTTPPVVQDDFEAGPGAWQILPGSQFSVVQRGSIARVAPVEPRGQRGRAARRGPHEPERERGDHDHRRERQRPLGGPRHALYG